MTSLLQLKIMKSMASKLLPDLPTAALFRYLKKASDFMKTLPRRDRPSATVRQSHRGCPASSGSVGRWAFNLASENLFALGSPEITHRAAYRTVDGHLRFLPL